MRLPRLLPPASLCGALVSSLLALPAQAQSLVQLFESARGYDASYQGARAQYDATLARAAQAKAGLLPSVGLSGGSSRTQLDIHTPLGDVSRGFTTSTAGVNAVQPIYRPANWATYEQSKRQAEIAQAVFTVAEQDLVLRVSQAYFDVLAAQDTLALVRAQKSATGEQLAFAKRNFEVGTSTITDSREAQARFDLVTAQEIAAENDLQVKKLALDQLVGRPGSQPVALAAPVKLPELPTSMDSWVLQAEDASPSIRQARLGLDVARLEVEKAEAGHKPTVDANLGYNFSNNPQGTSTTTTSARIYAASVGVTLNMPLFAGYAIENRIKETLALEEQSRNTLEATRRSVTQATRSAYLGLVSGNGQVKALEAAEVSSQSSLDANRLGYEVGVRINIDVLNSQSQLFQTKRDLALARYNVLLGNLRLRQAAGTLSPDDLSAINLALATDGRPAVDSTRTPQASEATRREQQQQDRQLLQPSPASRTMPGAATAPIPPVPVPPVNLPPPVLPTAPPPPVILPPGR